MSEQNLRESPSKEIPIKNYMLVKK